MKSEVKWRNPKHKLAGGGTVAGVSFAGCGRWEWILLDERACISIRGTDGYSTIVPFSALEAIVAAIQTEKSVREQSTRTERA